MKQIQATTDTVRNKAEQIQHRFLEILMRLFNGTGRTIEHLGIPLANLSVESIIAAARRETGLSDWGDESFRVPLKVLLESCKKDERLSWMGWMMIRRAMINNCSNRLHIQDSLKRHPELPKEQIRNPVFIISLPRTGTTLLQRLLSLDVSNRSPLLWEVLQPAPSPTPETSETDSRIASAEKMTRTQYKLWPDHASIHLMQAKAPEECTSLLVNTFTFPSFAQLSKLKSYMEWLKKQDITPAYHYYRLQLQILQLHFPKKRWVLKTPLHMHYLNELLAVFPDACIVQTHRDPMKVIPSFCNLIYSFRKTFSDNLDINLLGAECVNWIDEMIESSINARKTVNPERFVDIQYKDLLQNPVSTVRQIYNHFGFEVKADFEIRMQKWLADNPKNKHGVHHYSLEKFGLKTDAVKKRFSKYCDYFNILPE